MNNGVVNPEEKMRNAIIIPKKQVND